MKFLITKMILSMFLIGTIHGVVINTVDISEVSKEIQEENTLVLFNIAEVLMDTETSLGSQPWRKFIRARLNSSQHDALTLLVFEKIPLKVPELAIPELINMLQINGQTTFAFTSRGRHEWYSSQIPDVDLLTEKLLRELGIDFSKTKLNNELSLLPVEFADYFHEGIVYSTNTRDKGDVLIEILDKTHYSPSKIVFIDDKVDSLLAVEKALDKRHIPFIGYAYSRTKLDHADFDPMIANIQLDWLISYDQILTDEQAAEIKNHSFLDVDPESYLKEIVDKWEGQGVCH